jgi:hypothetical protein
MTPEQRERLGRISTVARMHHSLYLDTTDADAIDAAIKRIERMELACRHALNVAKNVCSLERLEHLRNHEVEAIKLTITELKDALEGRD